MKKIIANIVSLLLLVVVPVSTIGFNVNHHVCKKNNTHQQTVFHKAECNNNEKSDCSCCEPQKVEPVNDDLPPCCRHKAEAEKQCNDEESGLPSFKHDKCCINYVVHFSLTVPFISNDNPTVKIKAQPGEFQSDSDFLSFAKLDNNFSKQKIPKQGYILPVESIISYIHSVSPDYSADGIV